MMRPTSITVASSSKSNPIPLDRYIAGYAVQVSMPSAGGIYSLQYTLDDPFAGTHANFNTSAAWLPWPNAIMVNASTNRGDSIAFAPAAVRLNASAGVSAARPVTLTIMPFGAM